MEQNYNHPIQVSQEIIQSAQLNMEYLEAFINQLK